MPKTLVIDCIRKVSVQLKDESNIHWKKSELLDWFNDARVEVISKRPDAYPSNMIHVCTATAKQSLPDNSIRLLEVVGNKNGSGITPMNADILNLRVPGWLNSAETTNVRHFVYRDVDPKTFYLYPRPTVGHLIELIISTVPDPTSIDNFSTDTQTILIDDSFANAIQYYMLFRAWSKDAPHASNPALAQGYMQSFLKTLGDTTDADAATSPQ